MDELAAAVDDATRPLVDLVQRAASALGDIVAEMGGPEMFEAACRAARTETISCECWCILREHGPGACTGVATGTVYYLFEGAMVPVPKCDPCRSL
jgi:hypothetical protein